MMEKSVQQDCPKVSVIIPTYNRSGYLCGAVDSLLAQTYPNVEIIVVDDGSTDDTAAAVQRYGTKVRYIRQENQGNSAARNNGLRQASGDYVGFLDDDDIWLAHKIAKQVAYLEAHPDTSFTFSGTYLIDAEDRIIGRKTFENENLTFEGMYERCIVWSPSLALVRRSCLNEVGNFDEQLSNSADYDLWLRLSKRYRFGYINEILSKYRMHENGLSRNWDGRLRSNLRIFSKPEINAGKNWFQRRRRLAKVYYYRATLYQGVKNYPKAARNYWGALLKHPLIGLYYWPRESKKMRFSFLYRIGKVYYLLVLCWLKHGARKKGS